MQASRHARREGSGSRATEVAASHSEKDRVSFRRVVIKTFFSEIKSFRDLPVKINRFSAQFFQLSRLHPSFRVESGKRASHFAAKPRGAAKHGIAPHHTLQYYNCHRTTFQLAILQCNGLAIEEHVVCWKILLKACPFNVTIHWKLPPFLRHDSLSLRRDCFAV